MIGNGELIEIYKTDFLLVKEHNFRFSEIDEMIPYERRIYIAMTIEYVEKKKQLLQK
jgi:hypothetical protein